MEKGTLRHVRFLSGGRVLQIIAAKVDDAATYTCLAENVAGQEQRRFELKVHGQFIVHSHAIDIYYSYLFINLRCVCLFVCYAQSGRRGIYRN